MPAIAAAEPCVRSIVAQKKGGNLRPVLPEQQRILPLHRLVSPVLRWKTRGYVVKTGISRTVSLAFEKYRVEYMEVPGAPESGLQARESVRRQSGAAALRRIARITYGAIRCAIDALRLTVRVVRGAKNPGAAPCRQPQIPLA